jgi:hypothetical protein
MNPRTPLSSVSEVAGCATTQRIVIFSMTIIDNLMKRISTLIHSSLLRLRQLVVKANFRVCKAYRV